MTSKRYEFSSDFQQKVLALMYHRHAFLRRVADFIEPDFFKENTHGEFAEIILGLHKAFPDVPISRTMLFEELRKRFASGKIPEDEWPVYIRCMAEISFVPADVDYVESEVAQFAASKAMERALMGSADLLRTGEFSKIADSVTQAYNLTQGKSTMEQYDLCADADKLFDRLKDPEAMVGLRGVPTGIADLDECLFHGGGGKKEMMIVCGPPNRGKSPFLMQFGIQGLLHGENVLYYTLELSKEINHMRFMSCMTGVPMVSLVEKADLARERFAKFHDAYKLGKLLLHEHPQRSLKPSRIRSDLRYYEDQGIKIGMLVVDCADFMASDQKASIEARRIEHGDIYEQLRAIGQEFCLDVRTASQADKASLNKVEVDMDSMAEDFSKAMTADYVIGLCQTKAEKTEIHPLGIGTGKMRCYIAKNRNETRGTNISIDTDFTRMRVSINDWWKIDEKVHGTSKVIS
jgi:replicative DNA helicase